ncbi:glycine-rich domain-containing protein [Streptomyces parvulus]|uniref:glycine-rich domain-containing protein n=1 Tax=Streptomyces parvulus TaxID=146923 RepID=UPI00381CCADE
MASVCVCSDYFIVDDDGSLCLKPGTMGLRQVLYFGEPGTYSFEKADYPWLANVRVKVQAGGGGAAGARADAGELVATQGAAGGGYSESFIAASSLGSSESITVGAGGTAGDPDTDGGAGGNSNFGGFAVANGGAGGPVGMTSGTTPAAFSGIAAPLAGVGDYRTGGGAGGGALRLSGGEGQSGQGGESHLGHGGFQRSSNGGGGASRGFGGGAAGALARNNTSTNGTEGGRGIVIVELYG